MPLLTISSVQFNPYVNIHAQFLRTGPPPVIGKAVARFILSNNPTLYDGMVTSIYTIAVNQPLSLNCFTTSIFPTSFRLTIFDETVTSLKTYSPTILNSPLISLTPDRLYYLFFESTSGGGSPGDVIFNALQIPTVSSYFADGFTASTLPNVVTTYDSNGSPTFSFNNFTLVKGNNYVVSFGYEPLKSGSFTVTISDNTIATNPEIVNFTRAVSTFYAFQSLVSGKYTFTIKLNITGVGISTFVDLLPVFSIDKDSAIMEPKVTKRSEPIDIPYSEITSYDHPDDDEFVKFQKTKYNSRG